MAGTSGGTWEERVDPSSGKTFYFNPVERRSSWTLPEGASVAPSRAAPTTAASGSSSKQDGWEKLVDPATERVYYYNRQRRKSAWAPPAATGDGTANLADGYPDDWEAKSDPSSGRTFYFSRARQQSVWTAPEGSAVSSAASKASGGGKGVGASAEGWLPELQSLVAASDAGTLNKAMRGWEAAKVTQFALDWPSTRVAAVLEGWEPERQAAVLGAEGMGVDVVLDCMRRWGFDAGIELMPRLSAGVASQALTALYEEERVWRVLQASAALAQLPAVAAAQAIASWDPYNAGRVLRRADPATRAQVLANIDPAAKDSVMRALQELEELGDDDDEAAAAQEEPGSDSYASTPSTPMGSGAAEGGPVGVPGVPRGAVSIPGMGGARGGGMAAMQSELASRLAKR